MSKIGEKIRGYFEPTPTPEECLRVAYDEREKLDASIKRYDARITDQESTIVKYMNDGVDKKKLRPLAELVVLSQKKREEDLEYKLGLEAGICAYEGASDERSKEEAFGYLNKGLDGIMRRRGSTQEYERYKLGIRKYEGDKMREHTVSQYMNRDMVSEPEVESVLHKLEARARAKNENVDKIQSEIKESMKEGDKATA